MATKKPLTDVEQFAKQVAEFEALKEQYDKGIISLAESFEDVIHELGIKKNHVLKKADFSRASFYSKKRKESFTGKEILVLSKSLIKSPQL